MRRGIACLVVLAVAASLAPVADAAVCVSTTATGTYILTLGGIDAEGLAVSHLAVAAFSTGDVNGNGSITGTILVNQRGVAERSEALTGSYSIQSNCFITVRLNQTLSTGGTRLNALTGFVADGGATLILASPFDSAVQLTGTGKLVPF